MKVNETARIYCTGSCGRGRRGDYLDRSGLYDDAMIAERLLDTFSIISDQVDRDELRVILGELEKLLQRGERGAIVEFGCYAGTTSLFIRRLLDAYDADVEFHVYDSFEGLPQKSHEDTSVAGDQFVAGELAVSKKTVIQNFRRAGLRPPVMHKGWFTDVDSDSVPADVMFAFFDGDFYSSIKESFRATAEKFAPTATIIVDDYANEALPGAARATDEWLRAHTLCTHHVVASLAVIRYKASTIR